jgi:hypothetical protein
VGCLCLGARCSIGCGDCLVRHHTSKEEESIRFDGVNFQFVA